MLTAYFDDSGTHDDSDIVVWAGLFGNQYQWQALDEDWAAKLRKPSPHKAPIRCFHAADCHAAKEEFRGWSRTESDFLHFELAQLIQKKMLHGYAVAVSRKDYDELQVGPSGVVFGDAEGFCIRNVYSSTIKWARNDASYDPKLAFVFDNRPHRRFDQTGVHALFVNSAREKGTKPDIVGVTFSSASEFRPLQAADLLAWEYYQHAKELFRGQRELGDPSRLPLQELIKENRIKGQMAMREDLIKCAELNATKVELLTTLADAWNNAMAAGVAAEEAARLQNRKKKKKDRQHQAAERLL